MEMDGIMEELWIWDGRDGIGGGYRRLIDLIGKKSICIEYNKYVCARVCVCE